MAFPVEWVKDIVADEHWPTIQRDPDVFDLVTRILFAATLGGFPFADFWERLDRCDLETLRAEFIEELAQRYPGRFDALPIPELGRLRCRNRPYPPSGRAARGRRDRW